MQTAEYHYDLPPEAIAQEAAEPRDSSRLLLTPRAGGEIGERVFNEWPGLLAPGDLVVINDTRVNPWRLVGRRPTGGRMECLILDLQGLAGEGFFRPSRKLRVGDRLEMENGALTIVLSSRRGAGKWAFSLADVAPEEVETILERVGRPPLPPYIKRGDEDLRTPADRERYQTVFAAQPGAVAAPTAGLHLTAQTFRDLAAQGVEVARTTLHVGAGTFLPVSTGRLEDHVMHEEWYEVPPAAAAAIAATKARGGRVVALGTTVVRTLETVARESGVVVAGSGRSSLFIYPGFEFKVVDAILTNFHLPESTLLMLVCAFGGRAEVLAAYREALVRGFKFYSFGDAMFLW